MVVQPSRNHGHFYFLSSGHTCNYFGGGGGRGGITDKLQEEVASGAKLVYLLFDMSQVCMTLCVLQISKAGIT